MEGYMRALQLVAMAAIAAVAIAAGPGQAKADKLDDVSVDEDLTALDRFKRVDAIKQR